MTPRTYKGPARPVSLWRLSAYEKFERVVLLLCLMAWAFDMFIARPN